MDIAVYPGTFDPITLGHIDIIQRAARLSDKLIIGIASNLSKQPLFSDAERAAIVAEECAALEGNIEVMQFDSLVVDFAETIGARAIIRGMRTAADFDYETQMSAMNQTMRPQIETIFLAAAPRLQPIASRLVKEIAIFGGDVAPFLSPAVAQKLEQRIAERGLQRGNSSKE